MPRLWWGDQDQVEPKVTVSRGIMTCPQGLMSEWKVIQADRAHGKENIIRESIEQPRAFQVDSATQGGAKKFGTGLFNCELCISARKLFRQINEKCLENIPRTADSSSAFNLYGLCNITCGF